MNLTKNTEYFLLHTLSFPYISNLNFFLFERNWERIIAEIRSSSCRLDFSSIENEHFKITETSAGESMGENANLATRRNLSNQRDCEQTREIASCRCSFRRRIRCSYSFQVQQRLLWPAQGENSGIGIYHQNRGIRFVLSVERWCKFISGKRSGRFREDECRRASEK